MAKNIIFNPELQQKFRSGSEIVRHTVEANFGPEGRTTVREQPYDLPLVVNTGRRILQDLSVESKVENIATVLVRNAALKVADTCGDGTIATAILTDSLLAAGQKLIAAGHDPVALRRGIHKMFQVMEKSLKRIALSFDEISLESFASTIAKNAEISENVAKAFRAVGIDGVISVQDTLGRETILNLWDGVRYNYGLITMSFVLDADHKCSVLNNPYVLLSNVKINSIQDIHKILEDVSHTNSSLLIITRDMDESVQRILTTNIARAGLKVVVSKAPGFGETRRRNMLALAAKIGSLIIEENTGRELRDCGLEICARIGRAEVNKEATVLQGFQNTSQEMVDILQKHTLGQLAHATNSDEREKLQTTMSILTGKTAEILVGAVVEYEMFEKKYLYENTVRAVQNAARSGVVPGAGGAYLYLAQEFEEASVELPENERIGAQCLSDALRSLVKVLFNNTGDNGNVILEKLNQEQDPYRGYDVVYHRIVDLKKSGILMPRTTVEAIVQVSVETASALWVTSAAVINK